MKCFNLSGFLVVRLVTVVTVLTFSLNLWADGISLQQWQEDVADSLRYREMALAFFMEASENLKTDKPLSGTQMADLYKLNYARQELFKKLKKAGDLSYLKFKQEKKRDSHGAKTFIVGLESFLYYLLIDDNVLLADMLFQKQKDLRRILNEDNQSYSVVSNGLHEEVEHYFSFKMMARKSKLNNSLQNLLKRVEVAINVGGIDLEERDLVLASYQYQYKYQHSYGKRFSLNTKHIWAKYFSGQKGLRDFFRFVADKFVFKVVYAFGRSIGQIQWRQGKLFDRKDFESKMLAELKPMDVFFDKSRYKVTGRIIPGFWNHNAVWVGTEAELKTLGIWDHPLVKPHQQKIRQGRCIVEALGMGTVLNTLSHFMNVDDLAIARKENMSDTEIVQKLLLVFAQIGKKYDFNFNTNSESDVICSEVVMIAFPEIKFKQSKLLGKWSSTPSDLGLETLPGKALVLHSLYYEGSEIETHREWHMEKLIREKKTDVKSIIP
ncbi:MAG: YiiX/YebB-like N1pC/P60 family cysteine hydrolase [Bdellovibrionota bacterium]